MIQMSQPQVPKRSFGIQDILYILYKHKWKIALLSLLGFAAAAKVHMSREPLYRSEAKLLVKYVLVRQNQDMEQSQVNMAGGVADSVILTEIEILKSGDLALDVAEAVGVDRMFPEPGAKGTIANAAGQILGNLDVGVIPRNNVLHIHYGNRDRELSRVVLEELIKQYFVKHLEIHRSAAAFDHVSKQVDDARTRLNETEKQLDALKTASGISSSEDATTALAAQRVSAQEDLIRARAELAELEARIGTLSPSSPERGLAAASGAEVAGPGGRQDAGIPFSTVTEYKSKLELISFLQKRDLELRIKFKPGNRLIELNRQQMATYEQRLGELLALHPQLASTATVSEAVDGGALADQARLAALKAKIGFFETHLAEIGKQFGRQIAIGAELQTLERKKEMEETEYRSLVLSLKKAETDRALDPSRMPNITMIQHPSEPLKSYDETVKKLVFGLAGAGVALGLGLAFLIELLIDRRVKRPFEIQSRLQLPLLLTIPFVRHRDRGRFALPDEPVTPRIGTAAAADGVITTKPVPGDGLVSQKKTAPHFILPYAETIRDRLIFNFEVNDVKHIPKLVGVTGLSEGAGASTIAAGLAKSFADIRNAKVLLVDLSSMHSEENPLFGEQPKHTLSGALQIARNTKFKESPQNLYFASAMARRDDNGLTTFSLLHLYELLPHLQASQFDYIVFDMPPIEQTSRTLTMAGLMDKVLLVLDGENTSRDGLKWGYSELVKGRADVSCIFNKTRDHAPQWLGGQN